MDVLCVNVYFFFFFFFHKSEIVNDGVLARTLSCDNDISNKLNEINKKQWHFFSLTHLIRKYHLFSQQNDASSIVRPKTDLHIKTRVIDHNVPFQDVFNKHIAPALFIFIFIIVFVIASPQNGNRSQIRPSVANIGELLIKMHPFACLSYNYGEIFLFSRYLAVLVDRVPS